MKRHVFYKLLVIALTVFSLSACARSTATAADLNLKNINGTTVNLSDYKGKIIILDFFATWCPPCRKGIPEFIELQKQYADKGFTMIGISLSKLSDVKGFAESFGINYPVLIDDGYASAVYGPIRSIPMTFIINRDFKIVKKYIGYRPKEQFENDIQELLKQEGK